MKLKQLLFNLAAIVMLMTATVSNAANVIYIVPNGTGDGSSWENGADITKLEKLYNAEAWIKEGTYKIAKGFYLAEDIKMYGGFKGTETSLSERNVTLRPIITSNSTVFEIGNNIDFSAIIDGIEFANCDLLSAEKNNLIMIYGKTTFNNCIFRNNKAVQNVGIYAGDASILTINNCLFYGNQVSAKFGPMRLHGKATICNTTIVNNTATDEVFNDNRIGGIFILGGETNMYNTVLWGNKPGNIRCDAKLNLFNCAVGPGLNATNTFGYDYLKTASEKPSPKVVMTSVLKLSKENETNEGDAVAPLFFNPAAGDFHLKANSPLVAAGDDPAGELDNAYDLDGNPCIDDNLSIDIGAYQFNPAYSSIKSNIVNKEALVLYPNPVEEQLTVIATGAQRADIYNITGALVMSGQLLANGQLNVSGLAPGLYQVVVYTENGRLSASMIKK